MEHLFVPCPRLSEGYTEVGGEVTGGGGWRYNGEVNTERNNGVRMVLREKQEGGGEFHLILVNYNIFNENKFKKPSM